MTRRVVSLPSSRKRKPLRQPPAGRPTHGFKWERMFTAVTPRAASRGSSPLLACNEPCWYTGTRVPSHGGPRSAPQSDRFIFFFLPSGLALAVGSVRGQVPPVSLPPSLFSFSVEGRSRDAPGELGKLSFCRRREMEGENCEGGKKCSPGGARFHCGKVLFTKLAGCKPTTVTERTTRVRGLDVSNLKEKQ